MAKIIGKYQPYHCWDYTKKVSVLTDIRIMNSKTDIGNSMGLTNQFKST